MKMFRINFGSVDDNQNFDWKEIRKIMLEVDDIRETLDVDLEEVFFETRENAEKMLEKIRPYIDASVVEIVETD